MKKIVLATTIIDNENNKNFLKNISILKKMNFELILIINTNKKSKKIIDINYFYETGDIVESRKNLINICSKYEADYYFLLDSDIDLINEENVSKIFNYENIYDLINLYYKNDSPLPSFFTLSGSLTDFYNYKNNENNNNWNIKQFFDDSDFNSSTFLSFNKIENIFSIKDIFNGKSPLRKITNFIDKVNEKDFTSGGTTIYFNKEILIKKWVNQWPKYNKKSLKWFDSFRIKLISKKFKYAKVPIFVNHNRFNGQIKLSWDEVIRYYKGLNFLEENKNFDAHINHLIEIYFYLKGIIKKIEKINLEKEETFLILKIKNFINIDINKIIKSIRKENYE